MKELVAAPAGELAKYIPSMNYFILDENRVLNEELENQHNIMAGLIKFEQSRGPNEGFRNFKELLALLITRGDKDKLIDFFYEYFISSQKRVKLISDDEFNRLEKLSMEEAIKMWPESLEEYKNNLEETARNQGVQQGIEQGKDIWLEKGIEKGIEKGVLETALKLKQEGLSVEIITKCTGLSKEQINNL
jgi:predicted transposase/invertase (TIGR01784 family)